jgi:DNA polymerase III subunit gamma/tau
LSYLALARKWRPQNFDDIAAQDHIVEILKNAIKLNRVSHAYLFAGPRGIGKTTTARVLAKALNCQKPLLPNPCLKCSNCIQIKDGNSLDVLEIDGASNRGIDQVRDLRENVKLQPAQSKFKIYIIDEVHMLTEAAFNALLKTLEEPPSHVKFIFATTQPNKVPATILSRCQRFDFKPFSTAAIKEKLIDILTQESIDFEPEALGIIAESAGGSLRDGESLLDQLICIAGSKKLKTETVKDFLGLIEADLLYNLVKDLIESNISSAFTALNSLISDGRELTIIIESLISYFRFILHYKILGSAELAFGTIDIDSDKAREQTLQLSKEELVFILDLLGDVQNRVKIAASPRVLVEVALLKICNRSQYEIVLNRVRADDTSKDQAVTLKGVKDPGSVSVKKKIVKRSKVESKEEAKEDGLEIERNSQDLNPENLEVLWQELVKNLKDRKLYLASYLKESKFKSFESDILRVEVKIDSDFQRELIEEKDNKVIIEDLIFSKIGRKIRIIFIYEKRAVVDEKKRVENALNNPNVKKITRLFNAKVLKVIPKDNEV